MKKIWIPLVLLAVMMGVTGCMINRTSFQEEAVSYMEEKYDESFTWIDPVDGQLGSSRKRGYVSSSNFPGEKILVEGDRGEKETFRDNYVAYLQNAEACQELQTIASAVDENWKAFCSPEEIGLSLGKEASALEYLQNGACLTSLFVPREGWLEARDTKMEEFRRVLWEKGISANITVYTLPAGELSSLTRDTYSGYTNSSGAGRFVMDREGNFAVSKWR